MLVPTSFEMTAVRQAQQQDEAKALDVLRRSITELCTSDHGNDPEVLAAWLANKTPEHFMSWLTNLDFFCVVAESGDRLCGVGLLHRSGRISLCYLLPGTQRRGIGTAIYRALEEQAWAWGLRTLNLESSVEARAFYERCGFRRVGVAGAETGTSTPCYYEKQLQAPS
jgi:GNAT superfamily N-acetyltransferase